MIVDVSPCPSNVVVVAWRIPRDLLRFNGEGDTAVLAELLPILGRLQCFCTIIRPQWARPCRFPPLARYSLVWLWSSVLPLVSPPMQSSECEPPFPKTNSKEAQMLGISNVSLMQQVAQADCVILPSSFVQPNTRVHIRTIEAPCTPRSLGGGRYECCFDASQSHEDPGRGKTTRAPPRSDCEFKSCHSPPTGRLAGQSRRGNQSNTQPGILYIKIFSE